MNKSNLYIHKLVLSTNVFIKKKHKLILLKRSKDKQHAPSIIHPIGGKVELHEDIYTAAIREVREESGITIKNLKLEAIVSEIKPKEINWLVFYFSADYDKGRIHNSLEGDVGIFTKGVLNKEKLYPSLSRIMPYILDRTKGLVFATFFYDNRNRINKGKINILKS